MSMPSLELRRLAVDGLPKIPDSEFFGAAHPHLKEISSRHPHVAHSIASLEETGFSAERQIMDTAVFSYQRVKDIVEDSARNIRSFNREHPFVTMSFLATASAAGGMVTIYALNKRVSPGPQSV